MTMRTVPAYASRPKDPELRFELEAILTYALKRAGWPLDEHGAQRRRMECPVKVHAFRDLWPAKDRFRGQPHPVALWASALVRRRRKVRWLWARFRVLTSGGVPDGYLRGWLDGASALRRWET